MTPGDFAQIVEEMRTHQLQAAEAFCQSRGLPFDRKAYERQAMASSQEVAQELLFFGAVVFPDVDPQVNRRTLVA